MKRTKASEVIECLNHASMADKSGRYILAQKYRDRAQALIDVETSELESLEWWANIGIEIDLSDILEPADEYNAEDLIDAITTSD
jgi:hypothetical protein